MRTLKLIALIGFGALSAEKAAGFLAGGEEEFAERALPALQQVETTADCTPADPSDDLLSKKEEPLHLAALPVILTGIAAAGLLSGCEVNVGSGGGGFVARPSAQEIEEAKREAKELYPKDRRRRCEHIAQAEGASPQEREWMCRD